MSDTAERPEPDRRAGAPHPRRTARLHGQGAAEARFLAALRSGRLHHAWMLAGPRGVGKATLAWRIARHVLAGAAADSLDMEPAHPVFRQTAALGHPALALCRRPWDETAKRLKTAITVDEIRGLRSFFHLSAADAGWRVVIIDAADEMTVPAANALLKILEEPPPRALLLLVCHRPAQVLPTIRSRCRMLRCLPLGPEDLARAMAGAEVEAEPREAAALAVLAGGSVGTALELIEGDGVALYAEIVAALEKAPPFDRARAVALAEAAAGRTAAARYDATLYLVDLLLGRLARAAAGAGDAPVSDAEAGVMARLAAAPRQAAVWATHAQAIQARVAQARAVNLDPAQVILDTCLRIDAAAAEAERKAA